MQTTYEQHEMWIEWLIRKMIIIILTTFYIILGKNVRLK